MSAAQSCVGFGLFSLVFDYLGGGAAQALSISHGRVRHHCSVLAHLVEEGSISGWFKSRLKCLR